MKVTVISMFFYLISDQSKLSSSMSILWIFGAIVVQCKHQMAGLVH